MTTILTDLVQQFQYATSGWFQALFPIARNLFFSLAVIELVWAASWWVLERDDPAQILVQLLKRVMAMGFFLAVLTFADTWVPAVIDGFATAGQQASGLAELNPSTVIDQGIAVATSLIASISLAGWFTSPGGSLVAGLAALLSFLAFAVIAGQLALTLIEMYVVIGGGVLLLGLAGSRWTVPFAERYLSYAVAVGIKLFVLYLIIGVGTALASTWTALLTASGTSAADLFAVLGASLTYMIVAWQTPSLASSLLAGSVNLTLGTAAYTATSMGAVALGAKGIAAHAGASAVGATAAMVEAGRYARDAHATGAGRAHGAIGAAGALAREALVARARRFAGLRAPSVASAIEDRRALEFGPALVAQRASRGARIAASHSTSAPTEISLPDSEEKRS